MSDDLISRKAAYKAFSDYLNKCFVGEISSQTELNIGEIANVIKSIPVAFDKEKVMEQLQEVANLSVEDGLWHIGLQEAFAIVKKGGIE